MNDQNSRKDVATSTAGSSVASQAKLSIPALRAAVKGRVITPEEDDFKAACTVFYGGIERRPAVIVRAADAGAVPTAAHRQVQPAAVGPAGAEQRHRRRLARHLGRLQRRAQQVPGTDRRIAEGKARRAGMIAAKKKAAGGG